MDNNHVHLEGRVKRDAEASCGVLDFAIEVIGVRGRIDIYDCRTTEQSPAYEQLEGFVSEGEPLVVEGHLEKHTSTNSQRVSGVWVEVRNTPTLIYVDGIIDSEEE